MLEMWLMSKVNWLQVKEIVLANVGGFIQSVERPNKQNQGDESNYIRVIVLQ